MKIDALFLGGFLAVLSLALPVRADRNPDFDDDAKPILRMQPHLLDYVEHNFDVRNPGLARVPGDEERRPMPPFIFKARPHGSSGAYFITLLIQPGPQGRILKVVDPTQPQGRPPGLAGPSGPYIPPPEAGPSGTPYVPPPESGPSGGEPPTPSQQPSAVENPPETAPAPSAPAPSAPPTSATPSGPTADTPSGPVNFDGQSSTLPPAPTNSPSLAPPADPSPPNQ